MPKPRLPLLTLILFTPLAWSQDDDAARRAERAASNPMRMIIEAAKIKPKAKAPEAARPAETARPAEAPRPAARPVAEAVAAPGSSQPTAAPAVPEPTPVVAAAPETTAPAVAPAPAGPPESAVATVEVSATPRSDSLVVAMPAASPEPELAALKLASVVEPEMPRRLIGKVRGEVQVHVAFTVQADGRVADAAVRRSSHPPMDAAILEAVRQWRYEPIAAARPHEVQLVLRAPE